MIRYDQKGQIRKNIRHNVYLDYDGNGYFNRDFIRPPEYDHLNRFGDSTYVGPVDGSNCLLVKYFKKSEIIKHFLFS